MSPIITCPVCGNHKDGTIEIVASAIATVENGDSFVYRSANIADGNMTTCTVCGHTASYLAFKADFKPFTQRELAATIIFLRDVAKQYKNCYGAIQAQRCIALLKRHADVLAPGE